jgi:hypothetical protein
MAAMAGHNLTLDPMGKKDSKCFFSETTWTIETKLPRNGHWKVLYQMSVFLGSNVNLCPAVAAILDFRSAQKTETL